MALNKRLKEDGITMRLSMGVVHPVKPIERSSDDMRFALPFHLHFDINWRIGLSLASCMSSPQRLRPVPQEAHHLPCRRRRFDTHLGRNPIEGTR
jgi:hypothetical protein